MHFLSERLNLAFSQWLTTRPDADKSPQINKIPNEVLAHIFSYTSIPDLLNISKVCRRWHNVSNDNALWKQLFFQTFKPIERPKFKDFVIIEPLSLDYKKESVKR